MRTNTYATAVALSDRDLLARLDALAATEREAMAEMLAHLAALELRPSLYLAQGYGSLFEYCTRALHLTEDAACNRTKVVRVCQEFPSILDLLFAGSLSMTAVRLLGPHLTAANHQAVLARAAHKSRGDVELLVAEMAPRPDVPASVRKMPAPGTESVVAGEPASRSLLSEAVGSTSPVSSIKTPCAREAPSSLAPIFPTSEARPIIQPLAPNRYRVQFTIGQETHDRLRRVQSLVRREVPSGDVAAIFDRALQLLEQAAKSKLGFPKPSSRAHARPKVASRPAPDAADRTYESRIRFETDRPSSRHVPNAIKRRSGSAIRASALSSARPDTDALSEASSSSTTSSLSRRAVPRPSATSPFGAGGTTRSRPSSSSGLAVRRQSAKCARCIRRAWSRWFSERLNVRLPFEESLEMRLQTRDCAEPLHGRQEPRCPT